MAKLRDFKIWLFLVLVISFVVFVRVRLLEFPLERDEGELAYAGQLILQGVLPYSEAYSMKLPGTYVMYALIMSLFGQSTQGIHFGFMIINCATVLLIFLLSKKIVSKPAALAAAATYAVLSLSYSVLGFAAHATHFVVLFALAGSLLLFFALDRNGLSAYFGSGVLFGSAFIMKQHGLFFILFGVAYIFYTDFFKLKERSLKKLLLHLSSFTLGAITPFLAVILWIYAFGDLASFWFWTFEYSSKYVSQIPLSKAFGVFMICFFIVADGFLFLWILSVLGFVVMFINNEFGGKKVFVVLFVLFSFLTIWPGFYFRRSYFVTLLPAVAILVGIFIDIFNSKCSYLFKARYFRFAGYIIFMAAIGVGVFSQWKYFFQDAPFKLCRQIYGSAPFPESIEIAKFIKSRSAVTDRVAVFGSEPQIFFYSKRHSSTGHIYTYSLMEMHDYSLQMQQEMIRDVVSSNPKFVVLVSINDSWLMRPSSEKYIFNWLEQYVRNFNLVGVIDIRPPEETVYQWDGNAANYKARGPNSIFVYERRG